MRKNNSLFFKYILSSVFLIIGFSIGVWVFVSLIVERFSVNSQISIQIDPLNLLNLIATTILALYVASTLTKKNEQERVEKDIIISDLINFKSKFTEEIQSILNTEDNEFNKVNVTFKTLRINYTKLTDIIDEYGFIEHYDPISLLDSKIRDIKDLLTDTPVKKQVMIISSEVKESTYLALGDFSNLIFKLIVEVNTK